MDYLKPGRWRLNRVGRGAGVRNRQIQRCEAELRFHRYGRRDIADRNYRNGRSYGFESRGRVDERAGRGQRRERHDNQGSTDAGFCRPASNDSRRERHAGVGARL